MAQVGKPHQQTDFISQFELQAFTQYYLREETERWVAGMCNVLTDYEHLVRYNLASQYVEGKSVLDVACGSGKGSYVLATTGKAARVLGGDIDAGALLYAQMKYQAPNLEYQHIDATDFDFRGSFDVMISFETVEHFPMTEEFLTNIRKSLAPGGRLIISTPISQIDFNPAPGNIYHTQEWGVHKFHSLISEKFVVEKVYFQYYRRRSLWKKLLWSFKGRVKQFFEIRDPSTNFAKYFDAVIEEVDISSKTLTIPRRGYQIVIATNSQG